ncbi:MAG: hypothetical protein WC728_15640 [Elusimicrobiota bacterium]
MLRLVEGRFLGGLLLAVSLPAWASGAGYPILCPPGTGIVSTGDPASPYKCSAKAASAGFSVTPGKTGTEEEKEPEKSPAASGSAQTRCAGFNARFTPFHQESSRTYADMRVGQEKAEGRLRGLIAQQQALSQQLKRQASQSNIFQIRAVLTQQARSVDADVKTKQGMLDKLASRNEDARGRWQASYASKAKQFLAERPAGCQVDVLKEDGK